METEELEARRSARKAEREKAAAEQHKADLTALDELEEEHGLLAVATFHFKRPGLPTSACARTPSGIEYKRYVDQVGKAVDRKNSGDVRKAQETLARACWLYPKSDEDKAAMLAEYPGLLTSLAVAATKLAEGTAEEEGKD